MSAIEIGVIGIVVMLVLFFTGMPIAFIMAMVGVAGVAMITSVEALSRY